MTKITLQLLACLVFAATAQAQCLLSATSKLAYARPAIESAEPDAPQARSGQTTADAQESSDASIVGLWKTKFIAGGQVVDQGFDVWHSDGTEVLNDTPPPSTGNVCLGVWIKTGKSTYKLKHPSWNFDPAGNLIGTVVIREDVTVSNDGNSYKGTFTLDVFDLAGNRLDHANGTISAQRITVD
jgi:hypothetical protein